MNKYEFWDYIISFTKKQEINFNEDGKITDMSSQRLKSLLQLRALFTSYCLMFDISTDMTENSVCLLEIFNNVSVNKNLENETHENFDEFMLEFLV